MTGLITPAINNPVEAILAASPDCMKILSPDGMLLFVNDMGLTLMEGASREDLRGVYYPDLWPQEMRREVADAIKEAAHGAATRVEGFCPTLKGAPRWWETHFHGVKSSPDASTEVIGVTWDVSARRSRELALCAREERLENDVRRMSSQLTDADRRITEFIAILAHELRNPLAPIRSGLQLMRRAGDNRSAVGHVREMMERQVSHMVHLIGDLLDIARVTSGKMELKKETVELHQIIDTALEASAALIGSARHSLTVDIPPERLYVDGDATRLAQIFTNILNNAAKYTAAGGRISVTVTRTTQHVAVDVADTGIGIAADALASIFEMFTTVERPVEGAQGGLGIGLNLVRRLVELHGGSVVALSDGLGKGSRFLVTLPLAGSGDAKTAATERTAPVFTPRVRVLLVDDNVDAAASLSLLLELEDHVTRIANSGPEALRIVSEFKPDIALMDLGMPGMSGYEVARAIRKLPDAGNPVLVALTGWGGEADRLRSKSAGFDEHLTKPADIGTIEKLLSRLQPHAR